MSHNDELARVKLRIRALTGRTTHRGCTEAEAIAAAEMVGRLLERFALTMEEVDVRREPCVQIEVPRDGQRRRPVEACVPALARFCDCKVWLARTKQQSSYVFFGFEMDVGLAAYLFTVISRSIHTESASFRRADAMLAGVALRRALASFQGGIAVRVAERLTAMHAARSASTAFQCRAGNALVLVRHQVVEEAFLAKKLPFRSTRTFILRQDEAFWQGQAAGDRVSLHRAIGRATLSGRAEVYAEPITVSAKIQDCAPIICEPAFTVRDAAVVNGGSCRCRAPSRQWTMFYFLPTPVRALLRVVLRVAVAKWQLGGDCHSQRASKMELGAKAGHRR